jgi:hypothetical protein
MNSSEKDLLKKIDKTDAITQKVMKSCSGVKSENYSETYKSFLRKIWRTLNFNKID